MPGSAFSRCITLFLVIVFVGLAPPLVVVGQDATPDPNEDRPRAIFPGATPVSAFDPVPCGLWPPSDPGISAWEIGGFMQWPSIIMVEYAPGASSEGNDGSIGADLIALTYIQSGTFVVTAEAPMAVYRWKSAGTPEIIAQGTEFTAKEGNYFLTGPEQPGMRNNGDVPAMYQHALIDPENPYVIDYCAPLG
jgi:hypothetical protein